LTQRFLPGAIRQCAYVVHDLDAAMVSWTNIGVGPWLTMRHITQPADYRGTSTAPTLSIAFANSGPLQLELIEQHDGSASVYREFLDGGHNGFHHLAWWAEDYDGALAAASDTASTPVHSGEANGVRFAYFEAGGATGPFLELMELTDTTRWLADTVAEAAASWDVATAPIRPLI
jgi:Glyoxalase/Bleomycin resistance protein/Dioxygenase superfamily